MTLEFFVPGIPKPAGSKTAFRNRHTGRIIVTDASGAPGRNWRSDVKAVAMAAMEKTGMQGPVTCPVVFTFNFYLPRPKGHFGTGRNAHKLKLSAPLHPTTPPDGSKLARAAEDAMTGIVWKDDAQVVTQIVQKRYCCEDRKTPGLEVVIRVL